MGGHSPTRESISLPRENERWVGSFVGLGLRMMGWVFRWVLSMGWVFRIVPSPNGPHSPRLNHPRAIGFNFRAPACMHCRCTRAHTRPTPVVSTRTQTHTTQPQPQPRHTDTHTHTHTHSHRQHRGHTGHTEGTHTHLHTHRHTHTRAPHARTHARSHAHTHTRATHTRRQRRHTNCEPLAGASSRPALAGSRARAHRLRFLSCASQAGSQMHRRLRGYVMNAGGIVTSRWGTARDRKKREEREKGGPERKRDRESD